MQRPRNGTFFFPSKSNKVFYFLSIAHLFRCGLLLCSLNSQGFSSGNHASNSEKSIYSYIRALIQLGDFNQIVQITNDQQFDDPVMLYFRIEALMKVFMISLHYFIP